MMGKISHGRSMVQNASKGICPEGRMCGAGHSSQGLSMLAMLFDPYDENVEKTIRDVFP